MLDPELYRTLVPDAPLHRRTDRDVFHVAEFAKRAAATSFLSGRPIRPGLQAPSLVSSYSGSIDRILFALPNYGVSDPESAKAYKSLISALRIGTKFIVVHHESNKAIIEQWFTTLGHSLSDITLVPFPKYINFTDWAEDGYVALLDTADNTPYLMEPWTFPRAGDALIAEAAQEYTNVVASQAPLMFQGGNCLIGNEFWLLGKDYLADSVELAKSRRSPILVPSNTTAIDFILQLYSDYIDQKRRLVIMGTQKQIAIRPFYGTAEQGAYYIDIAGNGVGVFQPIFHIDMLITLVGEDSDGNFEVLVGSPILADQILGTSSPYSLNDVYDTFASELENQGMRVYRNPLVHRPTVGETFTISELLQIAKQPDYSALQDAVRELIAAGAGNSDSVRIRDWHHITWNNCLVENSASRGKHVYLPTFGHGSERDLEVIDLEMKRIWEQRGFSVHLLADFNSFARRQGVVHCIKKYVDRGS